MKENKNCICRKCVRNSYCSLNGTKKDWCATYTPKSIVGTVHRDMNGTEVFEPINPKDEKYLKKGDYGW